MTDPWLSVIMPTYNGGAHLAAALKSVAAQSANDVEVIAVDDGSTDQTLEILRFFENRLLRIIARAHTGNWVASTNHGLSVARGKWVCFLHQDDMWMPHRLAALREAIDRNPDVALVLHASWFINQNGTRIGQWRCPLKPGQTYQPKTLNEQLIVQNFVASPAVTFRRILAKSVGGLREDLWYTADWDLWLRLASAGSAAYIAKPLTGFRIHAKSQTATRTKHAHEMRSQLQAVLQQHMGEGDLPAPVVRVAEFAAELNVQLAAGAHGERPDWRRLIVTWLRLGPGGWHQFLRDSRMVERVRACVNLVL